VLELLDVTVQYGSFKALNKMNMKIAKGELVVLLGANGAGKSTLFRTISGLNKPAGGRIVFQGTDIAGWPADRIVKAGIVLCPEGRMLFPQMTVLENLRLGGYIFRRKKDSFSNVLKRYFRCFRCWKKKRIFRPVP